MSSVLNFDVLMPCDNHHFIQHGIVIIKSLKYHVAGIKLRNMVKRFSVYLSFATCSSFMLVLTAIGLLVIEYKRGTVQEIYDSSLVGSFHS